MLHPLKLLRRVQPDRSYFIQLLQGGQGGFFLSQDEDMKEHVQSVVALILSLMTLSLADRGGFPLIPDVSLFEPSQKAIIAWDGREQTLILSTDLHATETTHVVEIMPFPTQPEIFPVDSAVFQKMNELFAKARKNFMRKRSMGGRSPESEDVKFLLHKKIGAHNFIVTKFESVTSLKDELNKYLLRNDLPEIDLPQSALATIQQYIDQGFRYFVFDIVQIGTSVSSQQAVGYRFKSSNVFFPLKISRGNRGSTQVDVITINTGCRLVPHRSWCQPGVKVITGFWEEPSALASLDSSLYRPFRNADKVSIEYWSLKEDFANLHSDWILVGAPWHSEDRTPVDCTVAPK